MAREETNAQVLNNIDSEFINPIPVLYQSGYLTIKRYDEKLGIYRLGFPNREVEEGFVCFLLPYYASVDKVESPFEIQKFVREVRPVIKIEIIFVCCFQTAKSSGKCCFQTANGYLCI